MDTFNLSDKIKWAFEGELSNLPNDMAEDGYQGYPNLVLLDDVKEFIKRLKEEIRLIIISSGALIPKTYEKANASIDKLAGDKLI